MDQTDNGWKVKTLVISTFLGAAIGLATGYLLNRTAEESGKVPPEVSTGDAIKAFVGVFGLMRGIASLGKGD
jgi:hypothetical protein